MEKIGFVGLGIMGKPMSKNLIKAGHKLVIYDIVPKPVEELKQAGAEVGTSPSDGGRGRRARWRRHCGISLAKSASFGPAAVKIFGQFPKLGRAVLNLPTPSPESVPYGGPSLQRICFAG